MGTAVMTALISFIFGTLLGTYLKIRWERTNSAQLQKQTYKTDRYKTIILLMYHLLDFEKNVSKLKLHRRDIDTIEELIEELTTEWNNMLLFASDEVLRTAQDFIKHADKKKFQRCALAMRKDLWGGKVSLKLDDIIL